ncbi:uncharacterized protein DUF1446 [Advenella incenata]|uniref:Uncharacterized protein DUF1446 n=1 Tax=Advenella incenata TaxID=267800 RepID=A0A4Q7VFW4_9BURK|nr:acyclic terpene utilization AtuA family protein [Advenella incenata]RZT94889.1 uncharacterized protein DUF1446 [Advenella incenata]
MYTGKHSADIVRIGTGASFSEERIYPGVQLLKYSKLDYLVCECLAERTIARETLSRERNPELGYCPMLEERMMAFMPLCIEQSVRVVSNMGAANPISAAKVVQRVGRELGLGDVSCAVVSGDDVTELLKRHPELPLMDNSGPLEQLLPRMASANVYLGADVIAQALDTGAQVVITGRVADPSLYLGVLLHHFSWSYSDMSKLAAGLIGGHLSECGTQVTGGYFADPGKKDVPRLADIGYPYIDVTRSGDVTVSKTPGSGGRVDRMTCTEQLLYELHDPANYITPDCVVDVTNISFTEEGKDRIRVTGVLGKPRTDTYKAVIGYFDGYIGSGEVSFAGPNAVGRARLAAEVAQERFRLEGGVCTEMQIDLIGINSLHQNILPHSVPYEVRLRIAGRCPDRRSALLLGEQVRHMTVQGPCAAGGPINHGAREVLAVASVLVPRKWVKTQVTLEGMQ